MKKVRLILVNKLWHLKATALLLGFIIAPSIYLLADNREVSIPDNANSFSSQPQEKNIVSGIVKDAQGQTIIGASVRIMGTSNGTVSDIDGKFSLSVSPSDILEISFIGYTSQKISIDNKQMFNIVLNENNRLINDVVVVGYGKMKK